ncbi:MAG TPA: decarboxylating 6-phosphogluconate dehydrogenase [Thermomicrobiales bacterium]|nr:decarboxylating 6-phosphogluconate dehydrogenase [Thermomicrobiales bacterium]
MDIAIIGLGRMGANMVRRLLQDGHRVVAHNRSRGPIDEMAAEGAVAAYELEDVIKELKAPRAVWLMVPAGDPVDQQIEALVPLLDKGDIIIDGGNSRYTDTIARHDRLKQQGIHYLDAGTSGGVWGLQVGYCLMVGGPDEAVKVVEPAFKSLAPEGGYLHIGPSGSGHFVKMIHNGIEYGMMQAYAEGFEILEKSRYDVDLRAVADLWMHGSVVRSWLLELAERAFAEDPHLDSIKGYVNDSGEGRWTVFESIDLDVAAPSIYLALAMRFLSRQEDTFGNKVLAALRNQFGGHAVVRE